MRPLMIALGIAGVLGGSISLPAQSWGPASPPGPIAVLKPDLVCIGANVVDPVNVRIGVKNIGLATAPSSFLRVLVPSLVFGTPALVGTDASVPSLAPGQSVIVTVRVAASLFPVVVGATAGCFADPLNQLSEMNESNNYNSFPWSP